MRLEDGMCAVAFGGGIYEGNTGGVCVRVCVTAHLLSQGYPPSSS